MINETKSDIATGHHAVILWSATEALLIRQLSLYYYLNCLSITGNSVDPAVCSAPLSCFIIYNIEII